MRCISLWQPWASLIGRGKSIETRSWQTAYRGPIAVHAAKRWTDAERELLVTEPFKAALREFWFFDVPLPLGAVVAVALLSDCLPTAGRRGPNGSGPKYADWVHLRAAKERAFGDYTPGRFGWLLKDICILPEPIPFRGAQGLFDVPSDMLAGAGVLRARDLFTEATP